MKNNKSRFDRKYETRKEFKKIHIFTEGKATEPRYFKSKRKEIEKEIRRKNIIIKGKGRNTLSLVECAVKYIKKENIFIDDMKEGDECWVVFDKDDFSSGGKFDNAIKKAESNNIKVAYSNESFELWFLLHFDFLDSAIGRNEYIKKLEKKLGRKYSKKKEDDMYGLIKDLEENAIKNAKKLLKIHKKQISPNKKDPSTTVHLLVEKMNSLK